MGITLGDSFSAVHHDAIFSRAVTFNRKALALGIPTLFLLGHVVRDSTSLNLERMDASASIMAARDAFDSDPMKPEALSTRAKLVGRFLGHKKQHGS